MEQPPKPNPVNETRLSVSPEVAQSIHELADAWRVTKEVQKKLPLKVLIFAGVIIFGIGFLVWDRKVPSDTAAFLLGSIVTGTIMIVRDYIATS